MTPPTEMHRGPTLRSYLAAINLFPLVAKPILKRRLKRGKEHPTRWPEKLGQALAPRPEGLLVWLHAVGLGEVLSVRGLIDRLSKARPDLSFLVTSTTAASAEVFAKNAPARTIHQFLPIDAPGYRKRFLDHFKPDLCVWVEQDLWPGMVSDLAARGTPQCIVAARMNAKSHRAHQRAGGLFRDLYDAMALITAQDAVTAAHLRSFGADPQVSGSLKPAAPLLSFEPKALATITAHLAGRTVWAVAPAHAADMQVAMAAHDLLRKSNPSALLIIAPRFPDAAVTHPGPRRSKGEMPNPDDPIWHFDTFGELGLVYRLAHAVLIGGTFSDVEGHNPWEAAALGCAILHGPHTANFAADFGGLTAASGATLVHTAEEVVTALTSDDLDAQVAHATQAIKAAGAQTDALATQLLQLLKMPDAR